MSMAGMRHTEETKARMAIIHTGYKHSDEAKAKIAAAHIGYRHSDEAKAKIAAARIGKPLSPETKAKLSAIRKGRKSPFSGHKHSEATKAMYSVLRTGPLSHRWKGGRRYVGPGYVSILSPNHPHRNRLGYVYEHRLVMEAHLGRYLRPHEIVHHINSKREDNRLENLMLFATWGDHMKWHAEHRRRTP